MLAPLCITRQVLQCFGDLPMAKTAELLGLCKNSLTRMCQRLGMGKWPYLTVMRGTSSVHRTSKSAIVQHRYEVMGDLQRKHDPQAAFLLAALQAAEKDAVCFWRRYGFGVDEPWVEERMASKEAVSKLEMLQKRGAKGLKALKAFKEGAKPGPHRPKSASGKFISHKAQQLRKDKKAEADSAGDKQTVSSEDSFTVLLEIPPPTTPVGGVETEAAVQTFWPLITDQYNFCALFESDPEDVLQLGPISGQ